MQRTQKDQGTECKHRWRVEENEAERDWEQDIANKVYMGDT